MEFLQNYPKPQNLYFLTPEKDDFEKQYLKIRKQEGRIYADEIVKQLPQLPKVHPQYREWKLRQWNTEKLLNHLATKQSNYILDLGCGNGWLTHQIADRTNATILGMDINTTELLQASSLFSNEKCFFAYGDIFQKVLPKHFFDTIILNSCIQYFPDLDELINQLQTLITQQGEIHILDSPIYHNNALTKARQRTKQYYQDQKVEQMTQHYFHHAWSSIEASPHQVIYYPDSFKNRLRRKLFGIGTPFYWIIIKPTQ